MSIREYIGTLVQYKKNMKKTLLLLLCLMTISVFSQDITRMPINGKIIVTSQDKEGVAVYNSTTNKGALTDVEGNFQITAGLNDIIEFSALNFQDFNVTITEDIIKSEQLTVILVEQINKLDEVVLLPFGLTGNLNVDLENVRTYNVSLDDVYFGLNNIQEFNFTADYKTDAGDVAFREYNPSVENMLNVVNLAGFLVSQVMDIDKKKKVSEKDKELKKTPFKEALDDYSISYINTNFNIPLDHVDGFIAYVEEQGVDEKLLKENMELEFLEHITQLSKSYLKVQSEKN